MLSDLYLFVIWLDFSLSIATRARARLPLASLARLSLFLGAIASDMPFPITVETYDFPDIVSCSFGVGNGLSPPISSGHEVFGLGQSCPRPSWGCVHWFVFRGSEWCPSWLLIVAGRLEFLEALLEPLLSSFEVYEPLLLLDGCGSPIFVHHERGLDRV